VYDFFGIYNHGNTRQIYRDVTAMNGDTLAERYVHTIARIGQIARAGYQIVIEWECKFDEEILLRHTELKMHPIVRQSPLTTLDALFGVELSP